MFPELLPIGRNKYRTSRQRHHHRTEPQRRRRLFLEHLEDRRLLTTSVGLDAAWSADLIVAGDTDDTVTFQSHATNLGGGSLDVDGRTITISAPIDSAGDNLSLTATSGVTLNELVTTGGGAFVADADSDSDGRGTFTVAAAVMAGWSEQQKLTASDGAATDIFGHSVAFSGNTALFGAFGDDDNGASSGSAYTFEYSPGSSGGSVATTGGVATITAADVELYGSIDAGHGIVTFLPSTNGRTFDLGASGGSGQIVLTDEELDQVSTTSKIVVGNANAGNVTITGAISPANAETLEIFSGANTGDTNTFTPDVTISQLTVNGNVNPGTSPGILSVNGDFTFADDGTFTVEIGDTQPGNSENNHNQLSATGTVTLGSGVTLSIVS